MTGRVIQIPIAGSIAQRAGHGGHAWVFLQYLLGLRQLGYEPLFLDRLTPSMCQDPFGRPSPSRSSRAISWFVEVMRSAGLEDSYSLILGQHGETVGLPRSTVLKRVAEAPFLLNFMGFMTDEDVLAAAQRRIFVDIDPGFGQMWRELELHDLFAGHDSFVTIAENIGQPGCTVPTCGLDWITTRQPVVLDSWPPIRGASVFTSVGSWRGPYDAIEYNGHRYGLRVHEFRRFASLPTLADADFELALEIDDADRADSDLLRRGRWRLVDPRRVASHPRLYQAYIQRSGAELLVSKGMYVDTWSGWFSDRSICYLASGKPVLAQDTGFTRNYPTGRGLLSFANVAEAAAGAEEICGNYQTHSVAARELARDHFDARHVLRGLFSKLGGALDG
jgi:hypothetical protein